ncbi:pyridoxal-phosphate-dependent aminotransferase family protein [Caldicellulosiruptor sp. DIB 104C]|uniref:pyridoxal-phosphate-dependent aminotransferase family protein n=1 Tax=Caldicellulosiruptor sp. DIB 104C TaxID=3019889 RepID=UPI002305144A|nr:aminotransferase class V-fold PLP-dependent enzyme [Caldicellulosiruptor sp. DIB 104C]
MYKFDFFTAGQGGVDSKILKALVQPIFPSVHENFLELINTLKSNLKILFFADEDTKVVPIAGTGTASMEIIILNAIEENEKVMVGVNGFFGERICEIVRRNRAIPIPIKKEWGEIITVNDIEKVYKETNAKILYLVHGETSTGVLQPLEEIGEFCKDNNILFLVDGATTIGGVPFYMAKWNVNGVFTVSQKCLGGIPGISIIAIDEQYQKKMKNLNSNFKSFYLDLNLILNDWYPPRIYHHTQPYSLLSSLNKCIEIIKSEGIENRWKRHINNMKVLVKGLEILGLDLFVKSEMYRLPTLVTFTLNGLNIDDFVCFMKNKFSIYISKGLGKYSHNMVRLGLMAENSYKNKVIYILFCIYIYLKARGIKVDENTFFEFIKNSIET